MCVCVDSLIALQSLADFRLRTAAPLFSYCSIAPSELQLTRSPQRSRCAHTLRQRQVNKSCQQCGGDIISLFVHFKMFRWRDAGNSPTLGRPHNMVTAQPTGWTVHCVPVWCAITPMLATICGQSFFRLTYLARPRRYSKTPSAEDCQLTIRPDIYDPFRVRSHRSIFSRTSYPCRFEARPSPRIPPTEALAGSEREHSKA